MQAEDSSDDAEYLRRPMPNESLRSTIRQVMQLGEVADDPARAAEAIAALLSAFATEIANSLADALRHREATAEIATGDCGAASLIATISRTNDLLAEVLKRQAVAPLMTPPDGI